ncbi:MAG: methylated-DNA--[protein]-cysteine S-methyltransferase [Candidatus Zeuxoniibacter abyssi]|nr:MAG: methylated-DNA--[protein]-cysteine S-methyltransferase [Candidatus Persebacteraceae bacterium AB1(2)]
MKLRTPFAVMGLCCDEGGILSLHYLPLKTAELPPQNMLAQEVAKQIKFYLNKPKHLFDLFLYPADTPHRRKVREAVSAVKSGGTATYLDIARKVGSSPRAVGGACRENNVPLFVPCHRIVAVGGLGGFMGGNGKHRLDIKRWLLKHESV